MITNCFRLLCIDLFPGSGILPKKRATSVLIGISILMGKRQCEESSKEAGRSSAGDRPGRDWRDVIPG
jgi:hypothetical protein